MVRGSCRWMAGLWGLLVLPNVATAEAESEPSAREVEGRVVRVAGDKVVVNLGTESGLAAGDRIELFRREEGLLEGSLDETSLFVGPIVSINAESAVVDLGPNELVEPGTLARPTSKKTTQDYVGPPRVPGLRVLAFLRPFIGTAPAGGGAAGELSIAARLAAPLALYAEAIPLVVAGGGEGSAGLGIAQGLISFDDRYFEVGIGAGVVVEGDPGSSQTALVASQRVRIGALDGFNVLVRNAFYLDDDIFRQAYTEAGLLIPVTESLALLGRGSYSSLEYGFGELGMRFRVRGNGGPGTLYLTPTAGGAGVDRYVGPMVGLGVEAQL